jgi:four helix bundle suffix protein
VVDRIDGGVDRIDGGVGVADIDLGHLIVNAVNPVNKVNTVKISSLSLSTPMAELFDKHGGFRRLHSFTLATIVQLETLRFCRRFLTSDPREASTKFYDPKGRQFDQMTQAARSGRQNIIEGSERSSTSKDTEMKLTDVARASLSELRGDYEIFILDRSQLPWSIHLAEAKAINSISLDAPPFQDDSVHESAKHALEQRRKYARWLDDEDPVVVANTMLLLISRALNMLKSQITAQGKAFEENGGFSERLMTRRVEARSNGSGANAECPKCGKPMRRRKSAKGDFWGCSAYPECKGTRPVS